MKKSKQILIFLLYALIIGLVVLLRSHTGIILLIAIIGGALLMGIIQTGKEPAQTEEKESKEENISKEKYLQLMEPYELTKRELELGFLIASGFSNAKIAEELYISESTVKKHAMVK